MARRWATLQKAKRQQSILLPDVGGIPKEQTSHPLESHSSPINHTLYEKLSGYLADTSRMADLAHSQFGDRHWARQNIARSIT
ncbi:hypothetical protein [Chlorogloeopsis sp. ULAP02]|uniref:hypothetical protein n=1 Tax=Chlorogloeopsis sp. ULAP02 TaxID=3107926 RepID=UPI00313619BA